jgi:hypothetical protein
MERDIPTLLTDDERKEVYNYAAVEQGGGYCNCGIDHHEGRITGWSKVDHDGLLNSLERTHDGIAFELVPVEELDSDSSEDSNRGPSESNSDRDD